MYKKRRMDSGDRYIPRDILSIIESYIPLYCLSDADQARRVKKMCWPTSFRSVCLRATGFEYRSQLYWIFHWGNSIYYIHKTQPHGVGLYWHLARYESQVLITESGDDVLFRSTHYEFRSNNFGLLNKPHGRPILSERFLLPRIQGIIARAQEIVAVADIIVSHLSFKDKFHM